MTTEDRRISTHALRVNQWLPAWNEIPWDPSENRSEPPHSFYQFNLLATDLRKLSGVYARTTDRISAVDDLGIQRQLNEERSDEIAKFVEFGYPWSDLSTAKQASKEYRDLRQPGWLPTSVVVNILTAGESRKGEQICDDDLVEIQDSDNDIARLFLPQGFDDDHWEPSAISPLEIIDGQHRLWAFDDMNLQDNYELPVVAFVGLDLSWQAYLFYTINIKPKKINASLAYDLYPLLRTEKWLEKFEGHIVYRETRSQELVDKLWSHPSSPWHHRINMLGSPGSRGTMVTQSAWVRSLMASFVKRWEGSHVKIGGIFGAKVGSHEVVLPWSLSQQAAFLIFVGQRVQSAIEHAQDEWAESLRNVGDDDGSDLAFFGPNNLLNQDQGIRTLLQVVNDFFYINADLLILHDFGRRIEEGIDGEQSSQIYCAIESLNANSKIEQFTDELATTLATYDWRASNFPNLDSDTRILKASFRGAGGYKELRRHVLMHIEDSDSSLVFAAKEILDILDYR